MAYDLLVKSGRKALPAPLWMVPCSMSTVSTRVPCLDVFTTTRSVPY